MFVVSTNYQRGAKPMLYRAYIVLRILIFLCVWCDSFPPLPCKRLFFSIAKLGQYRCASRHVATCFSRSSLLITLWKCLRASKTRIYFIFHVFSTSTRCHTVDIFITFLRSVLKISTAWPSGLRRSVKAAVRKGAGSNPAAVTSFLFFTPSRKWW